MQRRMLLAAPAALLARPARAQAPAWPGGRQVRIVITYPPGGTTDFVARFLAQRMAEQSGGSFVVDNRSGGGGVVGWTNVVRSAPDGTTLLLTDNSLATAPPLRPDLGFDIRTDLTPVAALVDYPTVFVVPGNSPARTLREVVEAQRGRAADQFFYGSMGAGSSPHLYTEHLQDLAGVRMTHVPYRGMGPAFADLLAAAGSDRARRPSRPVRDGRRAVRSPLRRRIRTAGGADGAGAGLHPLFLLVRLLGPARRSRRSSPASRGAGPRVGRAGGPRPLRPAGATVMSGAEAAAR